ncbi:unnamed protein product [Tuber melanosporum]|uniref:(Perigord truffle) hypothetical protein n=1 Tax=Tuber melanosporum (strain Mel28) TaxID=656061 RepID=D5GGM6_TUBMM|nr:uncharacterized protein GSTUM_00007425001 [Tuber melanosporum]CAZ83648.1 unnamed protein product [Tuber melanosporum]
MVITSTAGLEPLNMIILSAVVVLLAPWLLQDWPSLAIYPCSSSKQVNTTLSWRIRTWLGGFPNSLTLTLTGNIVREPNPGLGGRQVKATRGKFLGGSGGCNGTLSIRGTKQDYDDWELPGWSGDDVWRCIEKAENYHPSDWMKHSPKAHGTSGPLDTGPYPLAPISNMVMDSFVSKGILLDPDMFSTGDNPHGCGHIVRTTYQGLRVTAANYLLAAGDNLTLKTETLVDNVVFDRNISGEVQATGLKVIESDGKMHKLTARREVIISGGAYCSPAILLRSGVGPKAELEKLGVEVIIDSPGVGKNLMDHLIVLIFYEVNKPGLTLDNQLYPPGALETSYKLWKEHKKGPLSSFPFGACAYTHLDERLSDSALWKSAPASAWAGPHRAHIKTAKHRALHHRVLRRSKTLVCGFPT